MVTFLDAVIGGTLFIVGAMVMGVSFICGLLLPVVLLSATGSWWFLLLYLVSPLFFGIGVFVFDKMLEFLA